MANPPLIFISYSHHNQDFVQRLVASFNVSTGQLYGDFTTFTDWKIDSGDDWDETIQENLRSCDVFIPVVSPTWLKSKWCAIEWKVIWERIQGARTRFVLPIFFALEPDHEKQLREALTEDQKEVLTQIRTLQVNHRFRVSLEDFREIAPKVGDDLANLLIQLAVAPMSEPPPTNNRQKVYLGYAISKQMEKWRSTISSELKKKNFLAVEATPDWSADAKSEQARLETELCGCISIVHFLEPHRGPSLEPREEGCALLDIQFAAAKAVGLPGILWRGPTLQLETIKREKEEDKRYYEIVDGASNEPVREFANSLLKKLSVITAPDDQPPPEQEPVVCLIGESGDETVTMSIGEYMSNHKQRCHVRFPGAAVEQSKVPEAWSNECREREYFFVYWGAGTKDWGWQVYNRLSSARMVQQKGGGAFRRPAVFWVYCGAEKASYKTEIRTWPGPLIPRFDEWDKPTVDQFISDVHRHFSRGSAISAAAGPGGSNQ